MLGPPTYQRIVIGCLMTDFPINLRDVVIHPTVVHPQQHIGIQVVVILQTVCLASVRVAFLIAIDTEWRYPKLHPRLAGTYSLMNFLDQYVHVVASPIGLVGITSTVLGKADVIRKVFTRIWVWIEIVVHVDSIYIVSANNILYNLTDILAVFRQSRIEVKLVGIRYKQLRILVVRMDRRQSPCTLGLGPVRINPRMKFHVALVPLVNHPLQRIPLGRLSLHAG